MQEAKNAYPFFSLIHKTSVFTGTFCIIIINNNHYLMCCIYMSNIPRNIPPRHACVFAQGGSGMAGINMSLKT